MQREAWTFSLTSAVTGAFGLLLRWLQCQIIFEEETGLPIQHATVSGVLIAYIVLAAAGLWWLSGRMGWEKSSQEPEKALAPWGRVPGAILALAGTAAGLGSVYMFLTVNAPLMRIAALIGLLAAPALAMLPMLPRWGDFGAYFSVLPTAFFGLWIVLFYKNNAVDPIVWRYGIEMLSIAGCLFGAYRLCGYLFFKINARVTLFACGMGTLLSLMVIMDEISMGERVLFGGWALGFGTVLWILIRNFGVEEAAGKTDPSVDMPDTQ